MSIQEQQIVIFAGRSGSGKGTQADLLQKVLSGKTLYVGSGAYFRKMIASESLTGQLYRDAYNRGELAPEFLVTAFLANVFMDQYTGGEHIIFDGVARLMQEAKDLTDMFIFYKVKKVKILFIEVSPAWALDKAQKRGRSDDKGAEIKAKWFDERVMPVLEYLKTNPIYEFITINGEQSIEDVHKEIISKL